MNSVTQELNSRNTKDADEFAPCPFCGGSPHLSSVEEKDERRYMEMRLQCCVTMRESLNYSEFKNMEPQEIEKKLRAALVTSWNTRVHSDPLPEDVKSASQIMFEALWRKKHNMPEYVEFTPFKDGSYVAPAVDEAYQGWLMAHNAFVQIADEAEKRVEAPFAWVFRNVVTKTEPSMTTDASEARRMKAMPNTYLVKDVTMTSLAQSFGTLSRKEGQDLIRKLLGEPASPGESFEDYE